MKRVDVALLVITVFVLFHIVLPVFADSLGFGSLFLYALFRFLSVIVIPFIMYKVNGEIWTIKALAVSFLIVTVAFFIIDLTSNSPTIFYILMLCSFYIFVTGLTVHPSYYYRHRTGMFLAAAALLLILRYSSLMNVVYVILADHNSGTNAGWDMNLIVSNTKQSIFILFCAFEYLSLDGLVFEKFKRS